MDEREFTDKLLSDLRKKVPDISIIDSHGLFDLFVEDACRFIEVKKVGTGGLGPAYKDKKDIVFSKRQSKAILIMKRVPIVVAFDDEAQSYYLYKSEEIFELFDERGAYFLEGKPIGWPEDFFVKKLSYDELLEKLIELIRSEKHPSKEP